MGIVFIMSDNRAHKKKFPLEACTTPPKKFQKIIIFILIPLALVSGLFLLAEPAVRIINSRPHLSETSIRWDGLATQAWVITSVSGQIETTPDDTIRASDMEYFEDEILFFAGYLPTSTPGVYENSSKHLWVRMLGLKVEHSTGADFSSTENTYFCSWVDTDLKNDGPIITKGRCS